MDFIPSFITIGSGTEVILRFLPKKISEVAVWVL
jgi:hypothetical protein